MRMNIKPSRVEEYPNLHIRDLAKANTEQGHLRYLEGIPEGVTPTRFVRGEDSASIVFTNETDDEVFSVEFTPTNMDRAQRRREIRVLQEGRPAIGGTHHGIGRLSIGVVI